MHNVKIRKDVNKKIAEKALGLIRLVEEGQARVARIKKPEASVIRIGRDYRAIKLDSRAYWVVCGHAFYNQITSGRSIRSM